MHDLIQWLNIHPLFWPLFIFSARVVDVSLGTLRTICVIRGMRLVASVLGFFEVSIWVTAISGVLGNLTHWYNVMAYAGGFATGNAVGILIEQRLALGMQAVRIISSSRSAAVAAGLRLAGYGVTEIKGHGMNGEVSVCFVVVPRKETTTVVRVAAGIDPAMYSTVEDVRATNLHTYRSPLPATGWRAILKRK